MLVVRVCWLPRTNGKFACVDQSVLQMMIKLSLVGKRVPHLLQKRQFFDHGQAKICKWLKANPFQFCVRQNHPLPR